MEAQKKHIVDQYERIHDYLRISLTERCNLRCVYCMPPEGIVLRDRSHFMTKNEVVQIAETFVNLGVKKIRLTGGEPLIRNDAKEIIEALSLLPVELAITTNGILIDQYIDTFKSAGLKSINVSLDSLQADKLHSITRRTYFNKIVSNIDLLLKEKFHLKINAVIIKGTNDDEILDFVEWTKEKDVHVRFIEFMPFNGNQWDWSKGVSFKEILNCIELKYNDTTEKPVVRLLDRQNDTAKNYKIDGYVGTFAVISSVTNPFCDTCNRMRLTADGKMKNCLFSGSETDLLSIFRKGEDITPYILESVWNKKAKRAGMDTFEDFANPNLNNKNRSMVAIGG